MTPNHPNFFFLRALQDPNGCKPCDCDAGGSYDNHCDVISGQCKCRPNVGGRRCDEVNDGFFTGSLDYLLFEGELARGSQSPVRPGSISKFIYGTDFVHLEPI
jgi:hypothetical protein